jgi:hypothetical protein
MRLVRVLAAVMPAAMILVAGCGGTTGGRGQASHGHVSQPVASTDLDDVMMTPPQLSDVVGVPLQLRVDQLRPVGGGPGGPCGALDTAGDGDFIGKGYSAFHVLLLSDGKDNTHDHVVTQSAAVYPDAQTATKQFGSATSGVGSCNGRRVNSEAAWKFAINDVTPDAVLWNKEQTDVPLLWVCYGQARVRDNVILQAMACQGDDGGVKVADAIVNHMSAAVWDLSAPNGPR